MSFAALRTDILPWIVVCPPLNSLGAAAVVFADVNAHGNKAADKLSGLLAPAARSARGLNRQTRPGSI
jgi:hypothetical protein